MKNNILTSPEPMEGDSKSQRGGVLAASGRGIAVTYELLNAQGKTILP